MRPLIPALLGVVLSFAPHAVAQTLRLTIDENQPAVAGLHPAGAVLDSRPVIGSVRGVVQDRADQQREYGVVSNEWVGGGTILPPGYTVPIRITGYAALGERCGGGRALYTDPLTGRTRYWLGFTDAATVACLEDHPLTGVHRLVFTAPVPARAPLRSDTDGDGSITTADVFAFLRLWFLGHPVSDHDSSASIEVADLFAFLRDWFAGA